MSGALAHYRVDVVEPGTSARRPWVRCEIGRDIKFNTIGLQTYCLAKWDERVYDMLVVAAAVEFCDRTKKRTAARWDRDFLLRVPVHEPRHWRTASTSLGRAVSFLTGDQWQFEFVARKAKTVTPRQGQLVMPADSPHVIIPYSDGLDSFAVAGLMKRRHAYSLLRVRLGRKSLREGPTTDCPLPFATVPYQVPCKSKRAVETSARSRGFKFTVLSGVAAYLSGAKEIVMPESGQGALGPSLVPVGQIYDDYRNHPLFTNLMTIFFSNTLDYVVRFVHPRLWHTKAETLTEFVADCPEVGDWSHTRTCWQNPRQVGRRQCGVCAACMLRRMSVHAAGLTECRQSYVWEDLTATRYEEGAAASFNGNRGPKGAMYEYAIAGTLHLDHLASVGKSLLSQPGLSRQTLVLSRSLEIPEEEVRTKLRRLIRQHEEEWRGFVSSLGPKSFVTQWIGG